MCGICGVYTKDVTTKHEEIIHAILQDQHARGPDHQALEKMTGLNSQVVLGHNRLSIIDLTNDSNQPMWDVTQRYCITFNGEIYNYLELRQTLQQQGFTFRTNGDTEVILNAFACWGIEALSYFQGPFAFAIFDKVTGQIWLCRDRFGVRPLYYAQQQNTLYFSSSTRILARTLNLKPNLAYVSRGLNYLVYEDGSDEAPYNNMLSLPAGSYLCAKLDENGSLSMSTTVYYNLADRVTSLAEELPLNNIDQLVQLIYEKLNHAVNLRLRTDVPLGIALSSGLDSSSIASLVREQHHNVKGFSYGHPDNKKSEGPLVAQCAKFLGMEIDYISPSLDEIMTAVFKTIETQDAPFSSLSIVAQFLLYQHINAQGIKVILGGQGGDESFMGYRKFMLFWLKDLLKQKNYLAVAKQFIQMLPMFAAELGSIKTYWQHRHRYFNGSHTQKVLQLPSHSIQLGAAAGSLLNRQIQDITQFSLPTLLRYEDRNAMGNSVESRLPFLDHRLVELGCALPEAIKLRAGFGKWPIRQMMANKIPKQIRLAYYKRGFDIPLAKLLQTGLGKAIRATLHTNQAILNEFLNRNTTVDNAFSDHQFMNRRSAISEAVTLLWLSRAYA